MKAFYTILLLIVSNVFMTFAWYGHLKLQEMKVISNWPLYAVILFSWMIALAEYSFQIPANRIGFIGNGGPFSLMQRFSFKQYGSEYCKDDERHYFLDNLKLHQRKRTAIAYEPDAIGRNLK